MRMVFFIGAFLMLGGILYAASSPAPSAHPGSGQAQDKVSSRIVDYSVFGGLVLVLIAWISSLKQ